MSHAITKSELFVELSEQEQELVAGGFGPSRKFGRPPIGPGPIGRPPVGPGPIGKVLGGKTPFGDGEGFKGFDGSPFDYDHD
jgi:hypothetical protein